MDRRTIRLRGFDYSSGNAYFITICAHNRSNMFGRIHKGELQLNPAGTIVLETWRAMPDFNPGLVLDECVAMPNHFHAVLGFVDPKFTLESTISAKPMQETAGRGLCPAPTGPEDGSPVVEGNPAVRRLSLPDIVRRFKT